MRKKDPIGSIYKITNIVNNKVLIGQSAYLKARWRHYKYLLRRNKYLNKYLQRAWNKYGEANFRFDVILQCPFEELDRSEIDMIKKYNSTDRNFGYNINAGGHRSSHTEETKQKIREWNLGRKMSAEAKLKMSLANRGKNNPNFGKKPSAETIQKRSIALRGEKNGMFGKTHTEEARQKIREAHLGKKLSPERIQKLRDRRFSDETKQKIRMSKLGKCRSEDAKQKMRDGWARRRINMALSCAHQQASGKSDATRLQ